MDEKISIRLEIDSGYDKPQVVIRASEKTELVERIIESVKQCAADDSDKKIAVRKEDMDILLNKKDIVRVYTESRKIKVCTDSDDYEVRIPLKELENILRSDAFVRISRGEIVNLKKVSSFDMSIAGTIKVIFVNGTQTWVARRFMKHIQERLAVLRKGGDKHE
jgi:DNA-binding LytR/AlgR family response regulator